MMDNHQYQAGIQIAALDLFSVATELPIGYVETNEAGPRVTFSETSQTHFGENCKLIRSFPRMKEVCDGEHCRLARDGPATTKKLAMCPAGLWYQVLPIEMEDSSRVVLLYGSFLLEDEERMSQSIAQQEKFLAFLNANEEEIRKLKIAFSTTKSLTNTRIEELNQRLFSMVVEGYKIIDRLQNVEDAEERTIHELQTRLQPVISNSENLFFEVGSLKPKGIQQMADDILSSAGALAVVVNNLGNFQKAYWFHHDRIRPLLNEAWRIYKTEARAKGIRFDMVLDPINGSEPMIDMSRQHLELAMNNLIHNAIKYSYSGASDRDRSVRVTGRVENDMYCITISNYGIGILPDEIEKGLIFNNGYQGVLTRKEFRTGSGKGLSFVKRVVENHHGRIVVESIPASDSEQREGRPHLNKFHICLPIRQQKQEINHG